MIEQVSKFGLAATLTFGLIGCEVTPPVDPAMQAATISEVNALYERACIQNTGKLKNARSVFNAHGFDNREVVGSAVYFYNDDDTMVAALIPFGFTETVGGRTQTTVSGVHCSVGSPIYRVDAGRIAIRTMAEKYLPDGFYRPVPRADGRDLYTIEVNPEVFGKFATWDSFVEVVIADEETQAQLRAEDPNAPIFAFIAGVGVTESVRKEE